MKILLVNCYYAPDFVGGAEKCTELLAETLAKKGHTVKVFCLSHAQETKVGAVEVYRADPGRFDVEARITVSGSFVTRFKNKLVEISNRAVGRQLARVIEEFSPDIVHCHNLYGLSSICWKICRKKGVRVVQTCHDFWMFNGYSHPGGNPIFRAIHRAVYRKRSRFVDFVTAPSDFALAHVRTFGYFPRAAFRAVQNGILMDADAIQNAIADKLKRENAKLTFLFVGALEEIKGIRQLLTAFRALSAPHTLLICGKGSLAPLVEEAAREDARIRYLGVLQGEAIEQVYRQADVCVVPSGGLETFGLVVIEALKNGCDVIGNARGGVGEILARLGVGRPIEPEKEGALRAALENIDRAAIRDDAGKIYPAILEYNIDRSTELYLAVYREVLAHSEK